MKKRINNKGFTLIELLALLVILSAIMGVAIPSFSSSLEKKSETEKEQHISRIEIAAEIYVTDYKKEIYENLSNSKYNSCYILISELEEKGYLSNKTNIDSNGNSLIGVVQYTRPNEYKYLESVGVSFNDCISKTQVVTINRSYPDAKYYIAIEGDKPIKDIRGEYNITTSTTFDGLISGINMIRYFCNIGAGAVSPTCTDICEIQGTPTISNDNNQIIANCIMKNNL